MAKSDRDHAADALAAMTGDSVSPGPPDVTDSNAEANVDDSVAAPAPSLDVFAPKRRTADLLAEQHLDAYRTAIPVLLTLGVLLPIVGSLKWLAPEGSPFAEWNTSISIVLYLVGAALLAVAVLNMRHVRNHTARRFGR